MKHDHKLPQKFLGHADSLGGVPTEQFCDAIQ